MTTVKLISGNNDETIEISINVAKMLGTVRNILEDMGVTDEPIPLPNVNTHILKKVLEYCEHYVNNEYKNPIIIDNDENDDDSELDAWEKSYFNIDEKNENFDSQSFQSRKKELTEIILASNYLEVKSLLTAGCKMMASLIRGRNPEEIRKIFDSKNDFTVDEEAQIVKENDIFEENEE